VLLSFSFCFTLSIHTIIHSFHFIHLTKKSEPLPCLTFFVSVFVYIFQPTKHPTKHPTLVILNWRYFSMFSTFFSPSNTPPTSWQRHHILLRHEWRQHLRKSHGRGVPNIQRSEETEKCRMYDRNLPNSTGRWSRVRSLFLYIIVFIYLKIFIYMFDLWNTEF